MFSITDVWLENFKSFAGENRFVLPVEPGLYFLTGKNNVEPTLGSNGAGKSTLLDAIHWCLFGRTLRGLKASDVVTWGKRSCKVVVRFRDFSVIRTQSPNSLLLNGRTVEQAAIDDRLRLNAESFVYSVILPQFGQSFFELKPAEKLSLFSQILNLDYWLEKSQEAAVATEALDKQIRNAENEQFVLKSHIASVHNDIKEFTENVKTFESLREEAVKEIEVKTEKLDVGLNDIIARKDKWHKMLTMWEQELEQRIKDLRRLKEASMGHTMRCEKLNNKFSNLEFQINEVKKTIDQLGQVKAKCPTCLQVVSHEHLHREKRKLQAQLALQNGELAEIDREWRQANKFAVKGTQDIKRAEDGIAEINGNAIDARNKLAILKERLDHTAREAAALKADLKAKMREGNPYTAMLTERQAKIEKLEARKRDLQIELEDLGITHKATSYWVQGFKRIRLFIIEESLRALELEVNNSLNSLGLVDWQVGFDVERENKAGGVTKGFVVFIKCPSHPEPVRWESWSGGETQRLQLAGDFGLANLIMQQAGLVNTVEFYDEPSNHLSDEGLLDLAETLHGRAITDGKRIILVDHRMPDFGDFSGVFTVVKNATGSQIE